MFSFTELEKIKDYGKMQGYCRAFLGKEIGVGTSRMVYRLNDKEVLKIAITDLGVMQNMNELKLARLSGDMATFINESMSDTNGKFLVAEQAKKAVFYDFMRLVNIDFRKCENFIIELFSFKLKHKNSLFSECETSVGNIPFFESLIKLFDKLQFDEIAVLELNNIANWGIVNRNGQEKIVILDLGNNAEIMKSAPKEQQDKMNRWITIITTPHKKMW